MFSEGDEVVMIETVRVYGDHILLLDAGARGTVIGGHLATIVKMRDSGLVVTFAPSRLRKVTPLELLAEQAE